MQPVSSTLLFPSFKQPQPQFTGWGGKLLDGTASTVQTLESNPLSQLMVMDLAGMILPRSFIELRERGVDMFLETFIREFSGLITNVLLVGWSGYAFLTALQSNALNNKWIAGNPNGIHRDAWINQKAFQYFESQFQKSLQANNSPAAIRQDFLNRVFRQLKDGNTPHQIKMLETIEKSIADKLGSNSKEAIEALTRFRQPGQIGQLTDEQITSLIRYFDVPSDLVKSSVIRPIESRLAETHAILMENNIFQARSQALLTEPPDWLAAIQKGSKDRARIAAEREVLAIPLSQSRIKLTSEAIQQGKPALSSLKNEVQAYGLSNTVDLSGSNGQLLAKNYPLKDFLSNLHHFTQQYVDRVLAHPTEGRPLNKQDIPRLYGSTSAFKTAVHHHLYGASATALSGSPGAIRPHVGLLTYAKKIKPRLIASAMLFSIVTGASVAFINNRLTRKRHQGEIFIPSEEGLKHDRSFNEQNPFGQPIVKSSLNHLNRGTM